MMLNELMQAVQNKTGHNPKRSGDSYSTKCPAHDDKNPSLSICEGAEGKLLLKCHAGCTLEEVCRSMDITPADLFQKKHELTLPPFRKSNIEYVYCNAENLPIYKKIRLYKGCNAKKEFQIKTLQNGSWIFGLKTKMRVLYNLPKVLNAIKEGLEVHLVEGEKDADRLSKEGLIATTPIEGAGSLLSQDYVKQLKGAKVVLLYDEDRAGHKRRDQWIKLLQNEVAYLKMVALPGLTFQEKHGHDITDWLSQNHTIEEFLKLVNEIPINNYLKAEVKHDLVVINLADFLEKDIQPREMILSPIIPTQGLTMLYAKRGVGKTFVALGIGLTVAAGGTMLKWSAPNPRKILYVDGEMPASIMQERLAKIAVGMNIELPDDSFFRLITPDLQPEGIPDLATLEGQAIINSELEGTELLILDNLSTLVRSTQENESDAWLPIQEWVLQLRRRGISVLIVHHAGKSGMQRGTSRREDVLDTVILLTHPPGYSAKDGAKFNIKYEKNRGFFGIDAEPFSVEVVNSIDAGISWEIGNLIEDNDELGLQVMQLYEEGMSYRKIADALGITKNKVEGIIKRSKNPEAVNE